MTLDDIANQLATLHEDMVRSHPPQVMNAQEAAAFLGVTDETLFRWRKDGFGPAYSKPTKSMLRYMHDDLVTFIQEHQVSGG